MSGLRNFMLGGCKIMMSKEMESQLGKDYRYYPPERGLENLLKSSH